MGSYEIDSSKVSLRTVMGIGRDSEAVGVPPAPFYSEVRFSVETDENVSVDMSSLQVRVTTPDWVDVVDERKRKGLYWGESSDGYENEIGVKLFIDDPEVAEESDQSLVMFEVFYNKRVLAETKFGVEPDFGLLVDD